MTALLNRRALLAWLAAVPLAGCAGHRDLFRAAHDPAETPNDWYRGQGCDGGRPRGGYGGRRRHRRRGRYDRDHCLDYRSAGEGYPDARGGSAPPPVPPPPASRRPH
jgi:hypothetical protein